MRAEKNDIIEIFGFKPDDLGKKASEAWASCKCPFVNKLCTKKNHKDDVFSGVCTVSYGSKRDGHYDTIICPVRLYGQDYLVLRNAIKDMWGAIKVEIGGTREELFQRACKHPDKSIVAIAFGQGSGKEISIMSDTKMSFDWVVQRYQVNSNKLEPLDFIVIEVQSTDTVNSYRDTWNDYKKFRAGKVKSICTSSHTINSANVHKRIIPQLIRKGNICTNSKSCSGFYFIVPEIIFQKFEATVGKSLVHKNSSKKAVSIMTYSLSKEKPTPDSIRSLEHVRTLHLDLSEFALAFISYRPKNSETILAKKLKELVGSKTNSKD